jgi:hypothetical protein
VGGGIHLPLADEKRRRCRRRVIICCLATMGCW